MLLHNTILASFVGTLLILSQIGSLQTSPTTMGNASSQPKNKTGKKVLAQASKKSDDKLVRR